MHLPSIHHTHAVSPVALKKTRYCSHDIQKELLKCTALRVQRVVAQLHQSNIITIMVDECTDVTNKEHVGLHVWASGIITVCTITAIIKWSIQAIKFYLNINIHTILIIGYPCSEMGRWWLGIPWRVHGSLPSSNNYISNSSAHYQGFIDEI